MDDLKPNRMDPLRMARFPEAVRRRLRIINAGGLHLRAAAEIVRLVRAFDVEITVEHAGLRADGRSIVSLACLAAGAGSVVLVTAVGREAVPAVEALTTLFGGGFGEGSDGERPAGLVPFQRPGAAGQVSARVGAAT